MAASPVTGTATVTLAAMVEELRAAGATISGGPNSYLVLYAPTTDVAISGNASFFGAALGKTLTISGNPDVHYDIALPNVWSAFFGF